MQVNFKDYKKLKPVEFWTEPMLKLTGNNSGLAAVDRQLTKFKPEVFIIDPLYKVLDERIGDQLAMSRLFDNLDVLAAKHHCAIIIIAHPRKAPPVGIDSNTIDPTESADLMGSNLFPAWADTVIHMTRKKNGGDLRILNFEATRYAEEELEPIEIMFDRPSMQFRRLTAST